MEVKIPYRVKRGTLAQWTAANPVLTNAEFGVVTDSAYIVVGDGVTAFLDLPDTNKYYSVQTTNDNLIAPMQAQITQLDALLGEEIGLRTSADAGHDAAVNALQGEIDTEETARAGADAGLQNQIDSLALAGIVLQNTSDVVAAATAPEQILYTAKIDDIVQAGGCFDFDFWITRTGAGTSTHKMYLNTTPTIGGTAFMNRSSVGNVTFVWYHRIYFPTSSVQIGSPGSTAFTGDVAPAPVTGAFDITSDLYIVLTTTKTVAADVVTLKKIGAKYHRPQA
jgi:hypothetical protein